MLPEGGVLGVVGARLYVAEEKVHLEGLTVGEGVEGRQAEPPLPFSRIPEARTVLIPGSVIRFV